MGHTRYHLTFIIAGRGRAEVVKTTSLQFQTILDLKIRINVRNINGFKERGDKCEHHTTVRSMIYYSGTRELFSQLEKKLDPSYLLPAYHHPQPPTLKLISLINMYIDLQSSPRYK